MAALVEILLPVIRNRGSAHRDIRKQLTEKFGGVTFHANAPAESLWKDGGAAETDQIIVVESWLMKSIVNVGRRDKMVTQMSNGGGSDVFSLCRSNLHARSRDT